MKPTMHNDCRPAALGMWLLSLLVLGACPGSRGVAPAEPASPSAAELTPAEVVSAAAGLVEQYRQAYEVRSVDALAPLYLHDVDLAVVHQGRTFLGWSAVEHYLRETFTTAVEVRVRLGDVTVVALGGGGAAVTATMARSVSTGTTTVEERGTLSLSLRSEGERWVIVGEHFSYVR
jgi:ketosteroid isomerase-like protein